MLDWFDCCAVSNNRVPALPPAPHTGLQGQYSNRNDLPVGVCDAKPISVNLRDRSAVKSILTVKTVTPSISSGSGKLQPLSVSQSVVSASKGNGADLFNPGDFLPGSQNIFGRISEA
eukprot:3046122-Rhodomonas_salina.1